MQLRTGIGVVRDGRDPECVLEFVEHAGVAFRGADQLSIVCSLATLGLCSITKSDNDITANGTKASV